MLPVGEQQAAPAQAGGATFPAMTNGKQPSKSQYRRQLLAQRRALTPGQIQRAATQVAARVWRLPVLARSRRLALYFPVSGELDCMPVIRGAWRRGRRVYLPVLSGDGLLFAPFARDSALTTNRFGIAEPACGDDELCSARDMDVIFAPLLGFDADGYRLGMGGGYYDRTLAFLAQRRHFCRPHFIGLAYEFQRINAVPRQKHDVQLEAVVTDEGCFNCRLGTRQE
ncbi:MAG: 5-formyltetrahydrofolate cyclo-ligase, partial [Gammaproteobacteria bacterium]|jgi:5-formyltetrahydrofolate cyclo-ligase|nr:5-formyltetrahydrofolate cyclo-ligase [Gammaproteobacteria bacterium]